MHAHGDEPFPLQRLGQYLLALQRIPTLIRTQTTHRENAHPHAVTSAFSRHSRHSRTLSLTPASTPHPHPHHVRFNTRHETRGTYVAIDPAVDVTHLAHAAEQLLRRDEHVTLQQLAR